MSLNGPAAARFYDEHVDGIYAYVARRLGPAAAVDVVGDVFEHALRTHPSSTEKQAGDKKNTERGRLLAIASALLRRHATVEHDRLVHWHQAAPNVTRPIDVSDPLLAVPGGDTTAEGVAAVMAAVADLDPAERDLLFLVAWEHCPAPLTAEATGISSGSVRSRLSAIRKELRTRLDDDGTDVVGRRTNPTHVVEAARPDVGLMPVDARRHVRERLFDVAMAPRPDAASATVTTPNTAKANALRLGALILLGVIGVGGLAYSASRDTTPDSPDEAAPSTTIDVEPTEPVTVLQPPPPTIAPTTTAPPVAGTSEYPLLFPAERSRLDDLGVTRKQLGGSSLLLRAPDLSTIGLREADGVAPPTPDPSATTTTAAPGEDLAAPVEVRRFGDLVVEYSQTEGVYDIAVPCGTLHLRDGAGTIPFRPELVQLFESMTLTGGQIGVALPAGWSMIDVGPSTDRFLLGIPVEIGDRKVTIRLAQYPGGNIANAGFGDKQFAPIVFRGQSAWISRSVDDPGEFEIVGMLGSTAFSVSTHDIALAELEAAMTSFVPGDVDEWISRFGALPTKGDPDIRTCTQQPEFVVT